MVGRLHDAKRSHFLAREQGRRPVYAPRDARAVPPTSRERHTQTFKEQAELDRAHHAWATVFLHRDRARLK